MKKRLFAILLALTLALSLLPTAVFATEGEDTAAGSPALAVQSDNTGIAVQAAHTHCYCGGSVTAGDHTNHEDVTYTACTKANYLRQIFYIEKVDVAYAYLENDMTLDYYFSITDGKTLYLCLNGHTLNLGEYNIKVSNGSAKLYLCDCSAQKTGTVSGGSSYCVSVNDGVNYNATFNMYGGTLKGGNTTNGGGVNVNNAAFNMYGGTITENTATSDGGGIYVGSKGTLNLYGGTITKNTVSTNEGHHGGGVYVESNKWTGVGKISIFGSPVITGNTRTYTDATTGASTTTTENLYLSYGFTNSGDLPIITLGTLTSGANIGIWAGESVFSTASETDYSGYFSSDVAGYHVAYNADKKLELKAGAAHVHSGGTAYCNKKAVCSTCGNEYGSLAPENHSGRKSNEWYGDDNEHWQVYSCCNAITNKAAHGGGTATCMSKALCTGCGHKYGTFNAANHDGGTELKNIKDATCTEKGYTGDTYCKGCKAKLSDGKDIPALDHDWGEPSYTWTAVPDGYMCAASKECKRCEEDVSELATVSYAVTQAPTCLNDGVGTYTATFSAAYGFPSATKDVTLSALGHKWGEVTYSWTENAAGGYDCTAKRVCENDSTHIETDNAAVTYSVVTPAACETTGSGTYAATFTAAWAAAQTKDATIPATGHTGGTEIKNAKAATCTEKGYTGDTYCKGCNAKLSDGKDIPAAGHKLKHVPAKNPTSFVAGNIEYWYCTVCGKYFRDAAATQEITKEATVTHKESAPIQDNKTVKSSKTGDAGVMLYAGMAVLSLTGCAWLRRKEK